MNNGQALGMGNRSKSLGAVLKERAADRGLSKPPDIEYELGNGDISPSSGDEGASDQSGRGTRRVVMMYDEQGNATKMPMANFYYDNVQAQHSIGDDDALSQVKGEADTVRSNVPVPFKASRSLSSESDSSINNIVVPSPPHAGPSHVTKQSTSDSNLADDAGDVEYEDNSDESSPFANQFMRIQVPAAQLKDVSRVKKDINHDRPQRKASMMAGLQRAVSSVRISDNSRTTAPGLTRTQSKARMSAAKIGRMMSFSKEGKENAEKVSPQAVQQTTEPQPGFVGGGLQRPRESVASKPGRRQGLAAVGRMMSMKKSKACVNDPVSSGDREDRQRSEQRSTVDRNSQSQTANSSHAPGLGRASLAQVGRMFSINRKKPSPVNEIETESHVVERASFASRASEMDSVHSDVSMDRERRDSRVEKRSGAPVRMGLAKMGRLMSFSRAKRQQNSTATANAPIEKSVQKDPALATQLSPLSSSTVSSRAVEGSSPCRDRGSADGERERARPTASTNPRKESSRMSLRTAGRLLSFSRKPQAGTGSSGGSVGQAAEGKEVGKRAQSVPRKNAEESNVDGAKPSEKLDGRASKFFYSEINSEKLKATELLGSETHIRVPVIAMAEYSGPISRSKWYIDAFTLPHNAVRRECIDLYEILAGMARFKGAGDITRDDINDFEDWWKTATEFFCCYFEMERTILFPWVDAIESKEWEVQMALRKMRAMKDKLQEQLCKVDAAWNDKTFKGPGEMYASLYQRIDDFVPKMMNYFADQEVLLPALVRNFYKLEDRLRVDKEMTNAFMGSELSRKNKEEAHHNVILLIRWMSNPRQLRAWIGKNLSSGAKAMYATWYTQYQDQHYRLVKNVRNRSKSMVGSH